MPPKKQKKSNPNPISSYFEKKDPGSRSSTTTVTQPGEATGSRTGTRSQTKVKEENGGDSMDGHLQHTFTVKFDSRDLKKYSITCVQPGTVLEAIKSSQKYKELKFKDENIVIQLGQEDKAFTVATHFPCSCISEGESLILSHKKKKVEVAQDKHYKTVHSKDKYSVFYIDTEGGLNTKTKKLFISSAAKQFKYLCVYGEKGTTVEEALQRDGRFVENLSNFSLSDNKNPDLVTECTQRVDDLDGKQFKLCLPKDTNPGASDNSHQRRERDTNTEQNTPFSTSKTDVDTTAVLNLLQQRGTSVRTAFENKGTNVNNEEIYQILREQFPDLKELMERRFPDDSYQEALDLRKEDFGKIQQSFSEVHRVRNLIKLGESVCKVVVGNVCEGTGFVLFDDFILTNAHNLKGCIEGGKLKEGIQVCVLFNYEVLDPTQCHYFQLAHRDICYSEGELDYAILQINPEGRKLNPTTPNEQIKVPPGLLKIFGKIPPNGEACLIGHPKGGLKKIDPTCIIEKEQREQAVHDHLHPYRDSPFILQKIIHHLKNQGIDDIMMAGNKADKVATYNTFMYHGSSGSPVFDANGQVFGLHTSGYVYVVSKSEESVIESAQPLLTIFKDIVRKLKDSGNEYVLKRVEEEAKGNSDLEKILNAPSTNDPTDNRDPTDTDEPMITQ